MKNKQNKIVEQVIDGAFKGFQQILSFSASSETKVFFDRCKDVSDRLNNFWTYSGLNSGAVEDKKYIVFII